MIPRPSAEAELRRGEAATWGRRPDAGPLAPPKMRLISWKSLVKNSLRGFATIELPIGLKIVNCPVLVSNGRAWTSLPTKPVLDRDGKHVKPDGKPQYSAILEWKSRDLADRFSQAVAKLVLAEYPHALDGSGAP
jgi:hypothetical protein